MAGPEVIDITGGTFVGPAFDKRRKEQSEEGRAQAASGREEQARADAHAKFILDLQQQGMELGPDGVPRPISRPAIGDTNLTGEDYLKTVPHDVAAKARMLIDGRMPWPSAGALRSPQMQAIISAATQADPTLDAANAKTRMATRLNFTSGKARQNITAINTALKHIHDLAKRAEALNNYDGLGTSLNAPVNSILESRFGDPRMNDFRIARDAVASELTRVFRGSSGNLADIEEWKRNINEAQSRGQLRGAIATAFSLLNGRLTTVADEYAAGMGKSSDPYQFLTGEGKKYYDRLSRGQVFDSDVPETEKAKRADVFAGVPEGTHAVGEDLKGFRLSPENESAITEYVRRPDATPEGLAKLMTAGAVAAGAVKPEQQGEYFQRAVEQSKSYFTNLSPEQRAQVAGGPDYSEVDKAASENAGLGDTLGQVVKNAPQSAYEFGTGIIKAPYNIGQLGIQAATDPSGTAKAVGDMFSERYGGMDETKRTLMRDPVGLLGDASAVLTGGGSAARRLGAVGAGRALTTAGAALDPLALTYRTAKAVPNALSAASARVPAGLREAAGNVIPGLAGFQSGLGGAATREAYGAGRSRGLEGAPTPQSLAFTSNMREPGMSADKTVALAQDAVGNLRKQASDDYTRQIQSLGKDPEPLPIADLFQTLNDAKPVDYDVWADFKSRPANHTAWERMRDAVVHYADQAAQNPALLEPMAVDKFKQALYDIGSKQNGAVDRDAARISGEVYQGTRKLLTDHDPTYASTMKNYGDAMDEINQLDQTFALGGKKGPNIDRASRRLQSIFRNNANTNYGRRAAQGDRLAELDTTGELMPSLAGQQASSWLPRSLRSSIGLGELVTAYLGGHGGAALLPAMALSSPRAVGELAYGTGRAVGTGKRLAEKAAPTAKAMDELYRKYPELALAGQRASSLQDETDALKAEKLRRKYALTVPGAVSFDMGS